MAAKAAPHFPFRRVFSACFWKCVCVFLLCCVLVKWASASLCRLCAVVFLPLCRGCGPPCRRQPFLSLPHLRTDVHSRPLSALLPCAV